jgi:hypothetical protein
MGRDGNLYVGVGDHFRDCHLYRYDPGTETIRDLGSVKDAVTGTKIVNEDIGKIHVPPYQAPDGSIYFATHTGGSHKPYGGHLFRYTDETGIEDLGEMLPRATYYALWPDERRGRLYFTTIPQRTPKPACHFVVYDLKTGKWEDKAVFPGKAPHPTILSDRQGNLYMYTLKGKQAISVRYDVEKEKLETGSVSPCLWSGAVTLDNETGYVLSYRTGELFRMRFKDWPELKYESLGGIDPLGRSVSSHNMAPGLEGGLLVVAGVVREKRSRTRLHGIWGYEPASGKSHLIADTTDLMSRSTGRDMSRRGAYMSNTMFCVDPEGWIYVGVNGGGDVGLGFETDVRLMAIRIAPKPRGD